MKIAFSIALLATLGLAYSVFFDGFCSGKKSCGLTSPATTNVSSECTSGCCSKTAPATDSFVSLQDGEATECSASKQCCSQSTTSEVALKQDGECSKCTETCSAGGSCCQEGKVTTVVVSKQDGECTATCSAGGSCCQEGKSQALVSADAKLDGEKACEGTCSAGGTCCQKGDVTSTVAVKQDGECCQGQCPVSGALVSAEKPQDENKAGTCCVADAMKQLPTMTYKVGTETTCCSDAAAKLAEKSSEAIHYVVAGEEFDCKEKAYVALVEKTEAQVNAFLTPAKCEASGQTFVADKSFACSDAAAKQTELVVNATKDIKVSYQVGGKAAACVNCAKAMSEKENTPIEYVVTGQTTKCELHARLMAAQAKYAAAVKAIASAENTVSTETTEKTETKSESKSEG